MSEQRLNLEEIAAQIDIVAVVQHYLPLTKKGRNYLGLCPFHDDSNPSMNVNPEKRIYKCFSCGAAGSAFTFVQNFEKIGFIDAVRKAADICGIVLPEYTGPQKASKYTDAQETLLKALDSAAQFYHYSLSTDEGKAAEDYLLHRGLTLDLIREFKLGYAPADSQKTVSFLKSAGHQDDALIASAMCYETAAHQLQDYQRGRVIFPIHDADGRTLGFSGRLLRDIPNEAKYTNTSESPVFQKGKILFNLHHALLTAKKEGYLYLVEGFMDAITLHRVGLTSVVATMGTALTKDHVAMLASLRVEIRLALDFDRAGMAAMQKSLLTLQEANLKVRVVKPPEHDWDADELFAQQGPEAVRQLYGNLIDSVQFLMIFYGQTTNFSNYESRRKYADIVMRLIVQHVSDPLTRDYYIAEVARKSGFSVESLAATYVQTPKTRRRVDVRLEDITYPMVKEDLKYYQRVERELVKCMVLNHHLIPPIQTDFQFSYVDDVARQVAFYIYDSYPTHQISIDTMMNEMENAAVRQFLGEMIGQDRVIYSEETIKDFIANHTRALELQRAIDAVMVEQSTCKDPARQRQLLKEITDLQHKMRQVKVNRRSPNGQ
jgi:DNA primase